VSQGLLNNNTEFASVALEYKVQQRAALQEEEEDTTTIGLYTASLDGVSLWDQTILSQEEQTGAETAMDPELVELIQRATFLEDNTLQELLQAADDATGLGSAVVDVRVFITPQDDDVPENDRVADNNNNLEIIIIIAIVVACVAFGLLLFAVVWAWRTDQSKREAFKVDRAGTTTGLSRNPDGTGSESDYDQQVSPQQKKTLQHNPQFPSEVAPQEYPESVISEDISTSLTAYYRSGMAGYSIPHQHSRGGGGRPERHDDAASMSSMDSYGYSLDGYAPSLSGGPTQMGYPVGHLEQGVTPTNGDELFADDTTAVDPHFPDIPT
jgi:hypothetical protein